MSGKETLRAWTVDREGWPSGPWDTEPDWIEWYCEGLPCRIIRSIAGYLCGYVGINSEHPWFRKTPIEIHAVAHRGLNRAGEHPDTGDLWWVGFDCGRFDDAIPMDDKAMELAEALMPPSMKMLIPRHRVYRTVPYVHGEVELLAQQAIAAQLRWN